MELKQWLDDHDIPVGGTYMPGAPALEQWLKEHGLSAHAFGLSLKLDPQIIRDLISGKRSRVDVSVADLIERGTEGAVTWRMWIAKKREG